MSYLLDKKIKRKKIFYWVAGIFVFLFFFYFRNSTLGILSSVTQKIFYPFLQIGRFTSGKITSLGAYFVTKNSLFQDNQKLKEEMLLLNARMLNYDAILEENLDLKEILERKDTKKDFILGAILSKPNQSPYDTLLIDVGEGEGAKIDKMVFAYGNIPIGRVTEVYADSSKVTLFSNTGERMQVLIPDRIFSNEKEKNFFEIIGRGGGNFEMTLPRDLKLAKGDMVIMPGINPFVVATTETVVSDPRDPFTKALLVSPVNIQELRFVEVEL